MKINNKLISNDNSFKEIISFDIIDLVNDSYGFYIDNTFTVFKSINDILILIYTNESKAIICFNIIDNKKIIEIKNAHEGFISNFRFYIDKINKRDLILSISAYDNNIKLWNINNFECLLNLKNINKNGNLYSSCLINDNNQYYIITSNCNKNGKSCEAIKIFDLNGNKIKEINDSRYYTYFIYNYYDKNSSINYIITGNKGLIKSYNYNVNKIYHKYYDNDNKIHYSAIIYDKDEYIKLIESSTGGNVRIWDFHSGKLLNNIRVNNNELFGICLWNDENLLIGCSENTIKIMNLKNGINIKDIIGQNDVLTIKRITHPKYGECFLTQAKYNNYIKIWIYKA